MRELTLDELQVTVGGLYEETTYEDDGGVTYDQYGNPIPKEGRVTSTSTSTSTTSTFNWWYKRP